MHGSNGTLLNLKFLPKLFESAEGRDGFSNLLRVLVKLGIIHAQFNVVRREDLLAAKADPDRYRSLTIRVAAIPPTSPSHRVSTRPAGRDHRAHRAWAGIRRPIIDPGGVALNRV